MVGKIRRMEALTKLLNSEKENFVTVVSVGADSSRSRQPQCDSLPPVDLSSSGYVTVLTIGDSASPDEDITEEVLVYRLPGERLGFGLKFEGGTKTNEYVKKLFIQSCAADSPASRVQSSWGTLAEGDEVIEIDSMPVNLMTRIDCVRCLKDSNVVIKLLVRHFSKPNATDDAKRSRSVEDLPQVVSAEKKRVLPPPPPVPPRKSPKKLCKSAGHQESNTPSGNPVPAARHSAPDAIKSKKFQSPRSSGRSSCSPDASRRDRRFSDGSLGPPDAKVYVDLFSQESMQNLSESDDTGSSISTVVDRFASFPTTTCSSLAGSLPSTPTSTQKLLDFSSLLNYDDDDLDVPIKAKAATAMKVLSCGKYKGEEGTPLQPPSCFQDAPLSYGNEDMRVIEPKSNEIEMCDLPTLWSSAKNFAAQAEQICNGNANAKDEDKVIKKPPVPPRSRDLINSHISISKEIHDENMNISSLPRLVDFVPKSSKKAYDNPVETINVFLENERNDTDYYKTDYYEEVDDSSLSLYSNELDLYSSKWSLSSQLATIGEDEEESNNDVSNRSPLNSTPIVIVQSADNDTEALNQGNAISNLETKQVNKGVINGKMEPLSSDSRQPPDGHESPDYVEAESVQEKFDHFNDPYPTIQLNDQQKTLKNSVNSSQFRSSLNDLSNHNYHPSSSLSSIQKSSVSAMDLSTNADLYARDYIKFGTSVNSTSLFGLSSLSGDKKDRLALLSEQRKQSYSKLKGLVIPEHVSDTNTTPVVNIPEIISHTRTEFVLETKPDPNNKGARYRSSVSESVALPLTSPPWASNASTLPKYSPAFKRKSLQVYPVKESSKSDQEPYQIAIIKDISPVKHLPLNNSATLTIKSKLDSNNSCSDFRLDHLTDAPKSLESITSPTRSDCSFDYVTSPCNKLKKHLEITKLSGREPHGQKLKDAGKSEDESDNDSAVSSSQSSYISRSSPPPWPIRSCDLADYECGGVPKLDLIQDPNLECRMLKAASVEAINRKNILASAKCRSGKDFKVGSPVIQRKYDDDEEVHSSTHERVEDDHVDNGNDEPSNTIPSTPKLGVDHSKPENNSQLAPTDVHAIEEKANENSCEDAILLEPEVPTKPTEPELRRQSETISSPNANKPLQKPIVTLRSSYPGSPIKPGPQISDYLRTSALLNNNKKRVSVTDIRKNFEKSSSESPRSFLPLPQNSHFATKPKKNEKPISKETKSTNKVDEKKLSLTKQKVQIEEVAVKTQKVATVSKGTSARISKKSTSSSRKVILCPEVLGASIGITLAGGTDYETKEITVHRIRYGSVAYLDGKLKRGDRIISINGRETAGLTHAESAELLKEFVTEFVFVVEDGKDEVATSPQRTSFIETVEPKIAKTVLPEKPVNHVVTLAKNGAGLGFSIDGGKDSLQGDLPLLIKKIFQGGVADKSGGLVVGDELLAINNLSLINLSKIEAWNMMKKLPDGNVLIHIHR